jgi:hypothetical protein
VDDLIIIQLCYQSQNTKKNNDKKKMSAFIINGDISPKREIIMKIRKTSVFGGFQSPEVRGK